MTTKNFPIDADEAMVPPPTWNGKNAWTFDGGILSKQARGSRHMLRNPLGWAIDIHILDWALLNLVVFIVIEDLETKKCYVTTPEIFIEHGIEIDKGYGPQIVLPVEYWEIK